MLSRVSDEENLDEPMFPTHGIHINGGDRQYTLGTVCLTFVHERQKVHQGQDGH